MTQSSGPVLRLGTRGSPLALTQARMVRQALAAAHGFDAEQVEITVIRTSGDRIQDRPLSEAGGKGLFTKEIEEALLDGRVDLAVHSMKDMPTLQPEGLLIDCYLPREDVVADLVDHARPRQQAAAKATAVTRTARIIGLLLRLVQERCQGQNRSETRVGKPRRSGAAGGPDKPLRDRAIDGLSASA